MSSVLALHAAFPGRPFERSQHDVSSRHSVATDRQNSWFQGGLPTPPTTRDMNGHMVEQSNVATQYPYLNVHRNGNHASYRPRASSYDALQSHSRKESGNRDLSNGYTAQRQTSEQIASHLQIPESVNDSKGSLAEFAAEITCLFWFEDAQTIERAESGSNDSYPGRGLLADALPSTGFRKWVTTILSTTQVGKNVILLALLFIYRLKKFNPAVSGKRGSEFRLLTIALMLGNKFLDDNTYTNKTWAEVSGISVNEIHIMEVEFLSNMRYELYASEAQWLEWKNKLGRFHAFYERATKLPVAKSTSPITPTLPVIAHKLPSPPSGQRHVNAQFSQFPNPSINPPPLQISPTRPYAIQDQRNGRKRSLDSSSEMPAAKRPYLPMAIPNTTSPATMTPVGSFTPDLLPPAASMSVPAEALEASRMPQLPMPRISALHARPPMHLAPLALPNHPAMSTVYPPTTAYSQPVTPTSTMPSHPIPFTTMPQLVDHTQPQPQQMGSRHTSPSNVYGSVTPTRPGLSPSYFLMNRSSPYRPVRHVNTLLIPPPSTAMQGQGRQVGFDQMQYHTLSSKASAPPRAGPVPFLSHDSWAQKLATSTPQSYRPF